MAAERAGVRAEAESEAVVRAEAEREAVATAAGCE